MKDNKLNKPIQFKKVNRQTNQKQTAKALYETARAGFKQGVPWTTNHFMHTLEAESSVVFTASLEENAVEKMIGLLIASAIGAEAEIYLVVVDEAYQKNRIAYRLFEHLLADLQKRGIAAVYLEVRISNKPAIGLYQAIGFEKVGLRKNYYSSPTEDALVMRLDM